MFITKKNEFLLSNIIIHKFQKNQKKMILDLLYFSIVQNISSYIMKDSYYYYTNGNFIGSNEFKIIIIIYLLGIYICYNYLHNYIIELFGYKMITVSSEHSFDYANFIKNKITKARKIINNDTIEERSITVDNGLFYCPIYKLIGYFNYESYYVFSFKLLAPKKELSYLLDVNLLINDNNNNNKNKKKEKINKITNMFYKTSDPNNGRFIKMKNNNKISINYSLQINIVNEICKEVSQGCGVMLLGEPGTGKTRIVDLIAEKLLTEKKSTTIVHGFNPTLKNNTLYSIISQYDTNKENPLIICIDEFDTIVEKINNNKCDKSERYNISVSDKSQLASLLDYVCDMQNVLFIVTSNKTKEWFEKEENKYIIRNSRFDIIKNINVLTSDECKECFKDGMKKYNYDFDIPNITNVTIGNICSIFKRCHGDEKKFKQLVSKYENL